jgi:hypothetical protein
MKMKFQIFQNAYIEIFTLKTEVVVGNKSVESYNTCYSVPQSHACAVSLYPYGHNGWEERHNGVNENYKKHIPQQVISALSYMKYRPS